VKTTTITKVVVVAMAELMDTVTTQLWGQLLKSSFQRPYRAISRQPFPIPALPKQQSIVCCKGEFLKAT
jgi:hypothetical protein